MSCDCAVQSVDSDDEVAKREALAEALTRFCSVVRKRSLTVTDGHELLTASGKLSMQHILPIYNVSPALSPPDSYILTGCL